MPIATVTVAGIERPKKVGGRGRIKGQDGKLFQATVNFLNQVNLGSTYDLEYQDREFTPEDGGQTQKFRVVESIVPSFGQAPAFAPPRQAQPQQRVPITEDRRGEDIATLAIVKEWIGRIPVGDEGALVHALRVARRGWLKFKNETDSKIESGPTVHDELNDEIPEF